MKKLVMFALATTICLSSFANADDAKKMGDEAKGKTLSTTCGACHGADGNSTNPDWPKLAGQSQSYLVKQLMDFRSDKRKNASMTAMAKGIKSDEDVLHLAAYFASNQTKLGKATPEHVTEGEAIYRGGIVDSGVPACAACHGPTGAGNPAAKFPKVTGQHAKYSMTQLHAFKSGQRANDNGKMMRNVVKKMTDTEMQAVAEYMAGLKE